MYRQYDKLADLVWAATNRPCYEADLWYNLNRNEITLEMLGDLCEGKRVISVGGGEWIEGALLKQIKAKEIIRTDIIGDPDRGIVEARAEALPYPDESFDVAILRDVIEHVPDDQVVFEELRRILKVGGYLLISTPNAYLMAIDGTIHVRAYTPITFIEELNSHGFSVVKKRGNIPYILSALFYLSDRGFKQALGDFKKIDEITKGYEDRYYLSTQLFVLAKKDSSRRGHPEGE